TAALRHASLDLGGGPEARGLLLDEPDLALSGDDGDGLHVELLSGHTTFMRVRCGGPGAGFGARSYAVAESGARHGGTTCSAASVRSMASGAPQSLQTRSPARSTIRCWGQRVRKSRAKASAA